MNDQEKLIETFESIGVSFETHELPDCDLPVSIRDGCDQITLLRVGNGIGYNGFYSEYYFIEGKFINHACWE